MRAKFYWVINSDFGDFMEVGVKTFYTLVFSLGQL